jgi:hypothetical protein
MYPAFSKHQSMQQHSTQHSSAPQNDAILMPMDDELKRAVTVIEAAHIE